MGYCPYYCIVCKNIEDNGWHDKTGRCVHDRFNLKEVQQVLFININLCKYGFVENGEVYTYSICTKCSRKFRYERDKLNGSCIKLYTKKKVNGKWIKINY